MKKIIFILISITILTSCKITKSLWQPSSYNDKIQNFVTTKGGGQIAFLGQKYHYIFDDKSGVMKRLLFWTQHQILYIDLSQTKLQLDEFNNISGYAEIKTIVSDLRLEDVAYLRSVGFTRDQENNWSTKVFLFGKRYAPNLENYRQYSLSKEYEIQIYYPLDETSNLKQVGKVIISPITITLDAILWLGEKAISIAN